MDHLVENNNVSLRDAFYFIFSHKAAIIIIFVAMVTVITVGVSLWPETYESSSKLLVKLGRENVSATLPYQTPQQQVINPGVTKEDINSEILLLNNRYLQTKLLDKLGIDFLYPEGPKPTTFFKKVKYELKQALKTVKDAVFEVLYKLDLKKRLGRREKALIALEKSISAEQVKDSDVILIQVYWFDQGIANEINKTLLDLFLEHHVDMHCSGNNHNFFQNQVDELQQRLDESEKELLTLKQDNNIISFVSERELLLSRLSDLEQKRQSTEREIVQVTSQIESIEKKKIEMKSSISTSFNSAYQEAELALMKQEIQLEPLENVQELLNKQIEELRTKLKELRVLENKIKSLELQIDIDKENYSYYRKKLEEARISEVLDTERIVNVTNIDPPAGTYKPVKPRKLLLVAVGLIVSIVVSLGYPFAIEYLDHSIKRPEQVENYVQIPVLASIPKIRKCKINKNIQAGDVYQRLTNYIRHMSSKSDSTSVMLTSPASRQGTTTVSTYLAAGLAQSSEQKVLLIELNIHRPRLRRQFKLDKSNPGILNLHDEGVEFENLPQSTSLPNLFVVTAGTGSSNFTKIMTGHKLADSLTSWKSQYQYIIVDSSSLDMHADTLAVADLVDAVILVVQQGKVRWEALNQARKQLERVKATVLGVVLNARKFIIPRYIYKRLK